MRTRLVIVGIVLVAAAAAVGVVVALMGLLLSDPGAFIMERRMLKGLKARVERAAAHAAA